MPRLLICFVVLMMTGVSLVFAQPLPNHKHQDQEDHFFQIDDWLPTPGATRTASGSPGPDYWQQRADYEIDVTLDDQNRRIIGEATIHYHNLSPHTLRYLWVQLDQNRFAKGSDATLATVAPTLQPKTSFRSIESKLSQLVFDGGHKIESVVSVGEASVDSSGEQPLKHTIVQTMMRIDLDQPLAPGASFSFRINYSYNIVNTKVTNARAGYEHFPSDDENVDDNCIYEIAQWFPRVVAYTDYAGWQHKQFLGRGEFTLELGDYTVNITAPENMVVTASGELQNPDEVLKPLWQERLKEAETATSPVMIITREEAKANEPLRSQSTKKWTFRAENVRDFAFAASRKFIWDAMGVKLGKDSPESKTVMAMSFYPGIAEPLWSRYSTHAIAHTLEVYEKYSFTYPYPVAISVNGPIYGMEYPMICFNGPRPEKDGTYSKDTKYRLISVVIHEVGHNFYPMIVNSDERQWTWMDEGLNTFLQYLTEQEWEKDYPSRRGDPEKIVPYMRGGNQRPIMTGSEEILQFGNNAYAKPATALNILRETILGRELFDFAFREYARRWKFKRPTPSDFFRTMEDASGIDLDWFWRGWFYGTDHVDIAITDLQLFQIDDGDPDDKAERERKERDDQEPTLSKIRNENLPVRISSHLQLNDFYNSNDYDEHAVDEDARKSYQKFLDGLEPDQRALLRRSTNFYVATFKNIGGLVMPIIARVHYNDNTFESVRIPAQIWRYNSKEVKKLFITDKEIVRIQVDPRRETADTQTSNNQWPPKIETNRFRLFKEEKKKNAMQKAKGAAKKSEEVDEDASEESEDDDS
ncbi:Aminopeptidase N [Rubripirellula obstinata]|uniref:Aminopeptidase N n=1 Tax=Rubripirellula obstinata TaxID=406547 RepID=A0A5B1CC96_9BACT|nr:M1 family metallopeptidase [Rubripirellula obstinata]KAA1258757.1 Aminopeptidase N [Rubripirellula obstinata]